MRLRTRHGATATIARQGEVGWVTKKKSKAIETTNNGHTTLYMTTLLIGPKL